MNALAPFALVFVLFSACILGPDIIRHIRLKLNRSKTPHRSLLVEVEDEDIIGLLEVYAENSPLAKKLLALQPTLGQTWKHDIKEDIPTHEQWRLFLDECDRVGSEDEKLAILKFWLDLKRKFSIYEKKIVIESFSTPENRQKARDLFVKSIYP